MVERQIAARAWAGEEGGGAGDIQTVDDRRVRVLVLPGRESRSPGPVQDRVERRLCSRVVPQEAVNLCFRELVGCADLSQVQVFVGVGEEFEEQHLGREHTEAVHRLCFHQVVVGRSEPQDGRTTHSTGRRFTVQMKPSAIEKRLSEQLNQLLRIRKTGYSLRCGVSTETRHRRLHEAADGQPGIGSGLLRAFAHSQSVRVFGAEGENRISAPFAVSSEVVARQVRRCVYFTHVVLLLCRFRRFAGLRPPVFSSASAEKTGRSPKMGDQIIKVTHRSVNFWCVFYEVTFAGYDTHPNSRSADPKRSQTGRRPNAHRLFERRLDLFEPRHASLERTSRS